ncbi:non-ribosomal peptide synthetase [Streptomyces sp. 142MFCol3.1]|uniref:non-ribosomal peptide synthetase n=1 Tax=Streptomyces sp. 142MFCol3.1 TaxID=1172179 RepID=UPI0003FC1212|nr:non-ribosomal peptide synthetase [Streptomyces sp. 142MFCol3.1]
MTTQVNHTQADRDYWRRVLTSGNLTPLPRGALEPRTGVGEYETSVPEATMSGLRRLASDSAVPLSALLLAAHAKVLTALSGEREITTGYVAAGRGPVPCRLSTGPASWRELLHHAQHIVADVLSHHQDATEYIDALRDELGLTGPLFQTILDPTAIDGDLTEDTVLRVGVGPHDGGQVLRLRYRTEVLDAACAARIAGYHLTALALLVADPDARHAHQCLLSGQELRYQLDGLAGPERELPDAAVHELFEQRVREHPDAVAAVHGDRQWTYKELNTRANRLARALVARGLTREGVVAVVTERNLDWLASVIAVFKAGGVYLPVEPHFPAERIAATLSRARCRLVLTEPGSTTTLDRALDTMPGVDRVLAAAAYEEDHGDNDPGLPVWPDQLAYVYFTSGSTGEPKGAMCEHAGMLNHLYAKIDDLEIGEGQVVAQTAPQCFDISLWQLISALLVGGRTLLVGQDAVLDVPRFLDIVADGEVTVLQVVPSYLEAVLTELEQRPRTLPGLRYVSVTGEALKQELAERWFTAQPGVALVNAYGLTETSDDTNHEVMREAPDRILLGPPVNNVRVHVVDEHLMPVPLGAPGLIAFSGVCVGRGYINDPERTRAAYLADPYRADTRLYLGGDYGRWHPSGKLEFLGRRDAQVKIRGFRIEIGEIENALLRVPGVRDGAVVVTERADQSKHLVAFYSGPKPLDTGTVIDRMGDSLPAYMIPAAFHWRHALPLTPNSKIDKKALVALAADLAATDEDQESPATPTERRLAAAWAQALRVPHERIGRRDHFFDRGGTSLSAVKLAIALDRVVSHKDVTAHPVLMDLAAVVDERSPRRASQAVACP